VSELWNIYLYVSKCTWKQILCKSYIHDIFITSVFKIKQELYIALGPPPSPQQKILGVRLWHSFDDRD
jgi:hypothetical protein